MLTSTIQETLLAFINMKINQYKKPQIEIAIIRVQNHLLNASVQNVVMGGSGDFTTPIETGGTTDGADSRRNNPWDNWDSYDNDFNAWGDNY